MPILNLTQHVATADQVAAGAVDPTPEVKAAIAAALTFDSLPTREAIKERAETLALIASNEGVESAMIGGAPYLMGPLEEALKRAYIIPLYAYSVRESVDVPDGNGGVRKTTVFRHLGFVG
jgi:hypothetical protein